MTITITGRLIGLNEYTKECRKNKYAGAECKKKAQKMIINQLPKEIINRQFERPIRLNFRWYEVNKKRDLDNICFAKKFILDSFVQAGIIKTDSWKGVIGFTDQFYVDSMNPRIEIDIEEVTE